MAVIPTFTEFLQDPWVKLEVGGADLTARWLLYDELVGRKIQVMFADAEKQGFPIEVTTDVLAQGFLESWFGAQWVADRFGFTEQTDKASELWRALRIQRMRELARRTYEFQTFDWFEHFIAFVRTNDVASALFEGDVLSALMVMPGNVIRNREVGQKGADFDITARLAPWELPIPVEVKAKSDETPFDPRTVLKSIKRAATQLPRGEIGWVFLRIPGAWLGSRLEGEYIDTLSEAVSRTSRIGAVFTALDVFRRGKEQRLVSFERRWIYFARPEIPDGLAMAGSSLHRFLADGVDEFAPRAPF